MKRISNISASEREILFRNTAERMGLPEAIIEKDFWVCRTLDYLFCNSPWKEHLAFKGGTSLSKCFNLIHRFSEDIDLILDWRLVGCRLNEPWAERSRNQQDKYNKAVNARTEAFLAEHFVPNLEADFRKLLTDNFQITIDSADPQTVCFAYPRLFSEGAILSIIRLEIGALAAWTPTQEATITPFVAEQYPQVFEQPITMRLMPPDDCLFDLRADYEHMKNMIYGEKPEFKEILSALEKLENEINSLPEIR